MKLYYVLQKELIFHDGVILRKRKLVILHYLSHPILRLAHERHIGIWWPHTQHKKMKFSIKDFFSKCDQIHSFLWIWSHLLKKSLMENFIFMQWYQFWNLVFYFEIPFVSNHIESSPIGLNDPNSNARITVVISNFKFMWSIFGETLLILVDYYSQFLFAKVLTL